MSSPYSTPQSKLISTMLLSGTLTEILPADATAGTWSFVPTGSQIVALHRMLPFVRDTGAFYAERYGALGAALTNGISFGVYGTVDGVADTLLYRLTDANHPIKTNADWTAYCYDANYISYGQGDNMLAVRWTFARSGQPIYLDASKGQYLAMSVADTLSGLVDHHVAVQGYYIQQ